jgi:hypothetical protein
VQSVGKLSNGEQFIVRRRRRRSGKAGDGDAANGFKFADEKWQVRGGQFTGKNEREFQFLTHGDSNRAAKEEKGDNLVNFVKTSPGAACESGLSGLPEPSTHLGNRRGYP